MFASRKVSISSPGTSIRADRVGPSVSADDDPADIQALGPHTRPITDVQFTWYLSLKDPSHQSAYDTYRLAEVSLASKYLLTAMFSIVALIRVAQTFTVDDPFDACIGALDIFRCLLFVQYTRITALVNRITDFKPIIPARFIGDTIMLTRAIFSAARTHRMVDLGQCKDGEDPYSMDCNPVQHENEIPVLTVLMIFAGSFILPIIFRCHTPMVNFICVVLSYATLASAFAIMGADLFVYPTSATVLVATLVCMYDYEYSNAYSFQSFVNMENAIRQKVTAENERQIIAENAKDLRHFIGNVAHDLKTPLQAFISELDCLEEIATTRAGRSSLQSLKSTCHYMTMTINRWESSDVYCLCAAAC
jgi:hypothetical protein